MAHEKRLFDIVVIAGSLRAESLSLKLARYLARVAVAPLQLEVVGLEPLPMYNEDLEAAPPAGWQAFRERLRRADGVLFITPEYNRSVPAVLKNALDVGSAPHGNNVFDGLPAAVISLSPGKMGAFGAHHHLRQSLVFLNMPAMQQPEAYLGHSESLFDAAGSVCIAETAAYLTGFLESYERWVVQQHRR